MKYQDFSLLKQEWTLPCCLQTIIKIRRHEEPCQEEIAERIGVTLDGFVDLRRLDNFLSTQGFSLRYENANQEDKTLFSLDMISSELASEKSVITCFNPKIVWPEKEFYVESQYRIIDRCMAKFNNLFMRNFRDNPGWYVIKHDKLIEAMSVGSGQYGFYFIDE